MEVGGKVRRKAWIKTIDIFLLGVMFVLCLTGCYGSPRDLLGINEYYVYQNGLIYKKLDTKSDDYFMFNYKCETKRGLQIGDSSKKLKKMYGNVAIYWGDDGEVSTVAKEIDAGETWIKMMAGCIQGKWYGYEEYREELYKMKEQDPGRYYKNQDEDGENVYFGVCMRVMLKDGIVDNIIIDTNTML